MISWRQGALAMRCGADEAAMSFAGRLARRTSLYAGPRPAEHINSSETMRPLHSRSIPSMRPARTDVRPIVSRRLGTASSSMHSGGGSTHSPFWGHSLRAAMLAATPQAIPGGKSGAQLLQLPDGVEWPQLGSAPLFIRHFYKDCYEGVLRCLAPGSRFLVRGNGGIGKSAFASYVLYEAVKAGRTTIYISDKVPSFFVFHGDGRVQEAPRHLFPRVTRDVRNDPQTVLLFDGNGDGYRMTRPPPVAATTILFVTPERARYEVFWEMGGIPLDWPVFSKLELEDMLTTCFPHLLKDEAAAGVWDRYHRWGGIPRYVFEPFPEERNYQQQLLGWIDLERLVEVLHDTTLHGYERLTMMHELFHLKPRGEQPDGSFVGGRTRAAYLLDRFELASPHVRRAVYEAMRAQRPPCEGMVDLLRYPDRWSGLQKFYDDMCEEHAKASAGPGSDGDFPYIRKPSASAR